MEFLKQLREMENINNEIFSDILEQSAITVVISHLNTLKHFVAVELRYSTQHTRGFQYPHIVELLVLTYSSRHTLKTECFWLLPLKTWMTLVIIATQLKK